MIAAICWVVVFGFASFAHLELCHRGVRTIVRQRFDDRITYPAVGTCDKGVEIAAVCWVEKLLFTSFANRDIGRNERGFEAFLFAFEDRKIAKIFSLYLFGSYLIDLCQGREAVL